MLRNKNIPRPQSRFKDMVDNSNSPFIPLIRHKPNALKPLPEGGGEGGWCRTVVCDLVSSFSTAAATSSLNAASSHREHQTMVQFIGTVCPSIPVWAGSLGAYNWPTETNRTTGVSPSSLSLSIPSSLSLFSSLSIFLSTSYFLLFLLLLLPLESW